MMRPPRFDDRQIEDMRRDLLNYKTKFGIGAPRLATLISEAHPNKPLVDQRRVARFLAKQTQPEEAFLDWCERFLKTVPAVRDPVVSLADGLLQFFNPRSSIDYTGEYRCSMKASGTLRDQEKITASVSISPAHGYWRILERDVDKNVIFEGALIPTATCGLAILKDQLTNISKTYTLTQDEGSFLGNAVSVNNDHVTDLLAFKLEKIAPDQTPLQHLLILQGSITMTTTDALAGLIYNAYQGNVDEARLYLNAGADLNGIEDSTGLSVLHIAIGRNHLDLVRFLIDQKASIIPDRSGRWPSTIAAMCEVKGEICDLVCDAEMAIGDV